MSLCPVNPTPALQMVLPKAQIEDNADATIVRAQMHLQELQVVDVDRICKQVGGRRAQVAVAKEETDV